MGRPPLLVKHSRVTLFSKSLSGHSAPATAAHAPTWGGGADLGVGLLPLGEADDRGWGDEVNARPQKTGPPSQYWS